MISEEAQAALDRDLTIDITTVGRNSGSPRKIEIWFHRAGDRYYITGQPGKRNWYANLTGYCGAGHRPGREEASVSVTADFRGQGAGEKH